jgi:hypothetical protein
MKRDLLKREWGSITEAERNWGVQRTVSDSPPQMKTWEERD